MAFYPESPDCRFLNVAVCIPAIVDCLLSVAERQPTRDAISVRRAPPGSALLLFSVEAISRVPLVMPHHQDEDAMRSDFEKHVIGKLLEV